MTVLVHAPYGLSHKESSLIYLFANYLKTINLDIAQITCNGAFSLCDKDEETGWRRTIRSCLGCAHNQKGLAGWSSIQDSDLSKYINADEVTFTRRVINEMSVEQLKKMTYGGVLVYDLCIESFRLRTNNINPDFNNKKHEQLFRRYMLSAVRMCISVKKLLNVLRPDMSLIASGNDFITRSYVEQSKRMNIKAVLFKMDLHERCIKVINTQNGEIFTCPLLVNDVTTMRADVNTWPKELINMMHDISSFLDVSDSQISLPLAQ